MERIESGYPLNREVDFQSVLFGELYKAFPKAVIRFEHTLAEDYQSYKMRGSNTARRKSRVDLHIASDTKVVVIELKYFKGSSKEDRMDMLTDLAKVERIVESGEANEGFCIQLVEKNIIKRLPTGLIETRLYKEKVGRWDYDFEIKGKYQIMPDLRDDGRALILHHVSGW
ncbi:hypothetical protein CBQ28_23665 [Pseudoalteromonas sp. GCY]|nr:hypothetical protein [Pseudoalteromonas sp. GCY]PHI34661.1 hypothetical protein CBQ28_23665 [Pseudoalteromonas sp. GCY]QQQ66036.1 hypothetical protein JJQ94_17260 [Pseudoalteromonas sp. GCY]